METLTEGGLETLSQDEIIKIKRFLKTVSLPSVLGPKPPIREEIRKHFFLIPRRVKEYKDNKEIFRWHWLTTKNIRVLIDHKVLHMPETADEDWTESIRIIEIA